MIHHIRLGLFQRILTARISIVKRFPPLSAGVFALALAFLLPGTAIAACTNPTGAEGQIIYNTDYKLMQFCNGTLWVGMGSGNVSVTESDPQVGSLTASKWCVANGGGT